MTILLDQIHTEEQSQVSASDIKSKNHHPKLKLKRHWNTPILPYFALSQSELRIRVDR